MRLGRLMLAVSLLVLPLAGCIGQAEPLDRDIRVVEGTTDPNQTRTEDEYWMVWIRGNETDERRNPAVCARFPPDYRLEIGNRSVVYSNRSYSFDPDEVRVLVAFDHEDVSSACPEAERLVADPEPEHAVRMGEWDDLTLTVREDGTLVADDHVIDLGEAGEFSYEGTPTEPDKLHVDGRFRLEVLGAWSQEGLQEGEP